MTAASQPTACVLIIGNEILSGRTQDANLNFLAKRLGEIGVRLAEARVIPDLEAVIVATVNHCRAGFDYLITTGGIGPTHDDITADSIAKAFGVKLIRHPEAFARLQVHYARAGIELNEARLRMANTPEGAILIDNPVSGAPGFQIGNVFVLAGIPSIMQAMFEAMHHRLAGGPPTLSRTITVFLPEGIIAKPLTTLQAQYPDLELGSYPFYRGQRFGTNLVLRGLDSARIDQAAGRLFGTVKELGGEPEYSD